MDVRGFQKIRNPSSRNKAALSTPNIHSELPENMRAFFLENSALSMPVRRSGLPGNPGAIFQENSVENSH